jgi:glycine oxidase
MTDLVVCGGGVIGLSIAYEAAKRCGWKVIVLESNSVGSGSSWAGAGILPPGATVVPLDPIDQLRAASDAIFPQWVNELQSDSQIEVGFIRCGGIYLAQTNGELATLTANEVWWKDQGISFERWNRQQLTIHSPALACDSVKRAWYLPQECQIRNPWYLRALVEGCRKHGVEIYESEELLSILPRDTHALRDTCKVITSLRQIDARRACITTGAWTRRVLQEFVSTTQATEIFPMRGQMVLFRLPTRPCLPVVNDGHRYLVPREDGLLLAGSCEEEVGFDSSTTQTMIDELKSWAINLMPILATATVEKTWSGLRPASVDGLPYLGRLPNFENVFVAAGHYRHGIHFSPITAKLMIEVMTGSKPSVPIEPFQLSRGHSYAV